MAIQDVYDYFRRYDKATYEVMAQMGAEPGPDVVANLESLIGFRFPDEFREFAVHPLGGLCMTVKEELWPRPRMFDVGPFWSMCYGFYVYCLSPEAPEWMVMGDAWSDMSDQGSPDLVPFLKVFGDADPYCFTADRGIVIWRHETPTEPELVTLSFSEVLMSEIQELERRKERKLKERQG
jgi:hypothetical protein